MADHSSIFDELKAMQGLQNIERAALDVFSRQWDRIFTDNKDSSGNKLSDLSTEPVYINTSINSPKTLGGVGKYGEKKFKNGKPHVTTYFSGGYKEFKDKIGGRPKLELFGILRKSYVPGMVGGNAVYGFIDESNAKIGDGLEDSKHFNTEIFFNTDAETELFIERLLHYIG